MKRLFTLLTAIMAAVVLQAQAPGKMSYQAVVRNAENGLVMNQQVSVRIGILKGSAEGSVVFEETFSVTTNSNGLLTLDIGGGNPVSGTFSTIDWSHGPYFIKTEMDPSGGTNYTISGTSMILSVPYALFASKADSILGGVTEKQGLSDVVAINNSANRQIRNVGNPTDARDAATKAYVDSMQLQFIDLLAKAGFYVKDIEGNYYTKVVIGNQTWLGSDLKTTKLNDGTAIPELEESNDWDSTDAPAYCWYNNDSAFASATYGALYNWQTVETGKVCPAGWHVPDTADWNDLAQYLGGTDIAGGKLKEAGTAHWNSPNTGATNSSGFGARGGGIRESAGDFKFILESENWWSATEYSDPHDAYFYFLLNTSNSIQTNSYSKLGGYSVRCLKN